MPKGFTGVIATALLIGCIVPCTGFAQSPPASLLVRCNDPMSMAQGEIVYAADNSLTLHLDFSPSPAPMPGEEQASVTGNLTMTCMNSGATYSSAFGGELSWFGWDFEHRFAPVLAQIGPTLNDTEPCLKPQLDINLSLNGGPSVICDIGFFGLMPGMP